MSRPDVTRDWSTIAHPVGKPTTSEAPDGGRHGPRRDCNPDADPAHPGDLGDPLEGSLFGAGGR